MTYIHTYIAGVCPPKRFVVSLDSRYSPLNYAAAPEEEKSAASALERERCEMENQDVMFSCP